MKLYFEARKTVQRRTREIKDKFPELKAWGVLGM